MAHSRRTLLHGLLQADGVGVERDRGVEALRLFKRIQRALCMATNKKGIRYKIQTSNMRNINKVIKRRQVRLWLSSYACKYACACVCVYVFVCVRQCVRCEPMSLCLCMCVPASGLLSCASMCASSFSSSSQNFTSCTVSPEAPMFSMLGMYIVSMRACYRITYTYKNCELLHVHAVIHTSAHAHVHAHPPHSQRHVPVQLGDLLNVLDPVVDDRLQRVEELGVLGALAQLLEPHRLAACLCLHIIPVSEMYAYMNVMDMSATAHELVVNGKRIHSTSQRRCDKRGKTK